MPAAEVGVLMLLLVPLAFIDLEHHLLPDVLTLPGLALGLGGAALEGWPILRDALLGAAVGALIPTAVIVGYRWLRGREGMGWGDVKLLAMVGAFLGWRGMLLTLVLGSLVGGAVGLGLIALGRGRRDTELPFGTFLCVGGRPVAFWAPELVRAPGVGRAVSSVLPSRRFREAQLLIGVALLCSSPWWRWSWGAC